MITTHSGQQRSAGLAALYLAAAFVAAMLYFLIGTGYPSVTDPVQKVDLLVTHQLGIHLMYLVAYVGLGLVLAVLVLGLHARLAAAAPATARVASAFGLIWAGMLIASGMVFIVGMGSVVDLQAADPAAAVAAWQAIEPVALGLGGAGGEVLGGMWVLLVSVVALRGRALPRPLNWLGLIVGAAGIASTVPVLALPAGVVFGLLQIVWFAGLGIAVLREPPAEVSRPPAVPLAGVAG